METYEETQARWTEWLGRQLAVMTADEVKAVLIEASRIRQESWDQLEARMSFDDFDGMDINSLLAPHADEEGTV